MRTDRTPYLALRSAVLLLWVGLLCPTGNAGAQTDRPLTYPERTPVAPAERRDFDRAAWRALVADLDYEAAPPEREAPEPSAAEPRPRAARNGDGGWVLLKVLGILVALAGLILIVYRLLGDGSSLFASSKRLRGGATPIDLENIEEHLESTELESYIERAVRTGDYRTAVRLYYLDVLKALSARGLLRWKRDKTNGEYLRELGDHPLRTGFREATRVFERVWYGRAELTADAFDRLRPDLENLVRAARAASPARA